MPRRDEADIDRADRRHRARHRLLPALRKALAIAQGHDRQRLARRQDGAVSRPRMVGMAMGDQRPRHRANRIDMNVSQRAIEAGRRRDQQLRRAHCLVWCMGVR